MVAFLDRSPLCLVATSTLGEPPPVLRMQLALLHGQVASLLTAAALTSIFSKSPGFDARRLLGGADAMLDSLVRSFTSSPAALLGAYPSLPLLRGVRTAVLQAVRSAVQSTRCLFGLLVGAGAVVATAASPAAKQPLQQWDVLLLLNFLASNEGLKRAETLTPLCLPSYNPAGHLHAYIHFLDPGAGTALVLLSGSRDVDFQTLATAREVLVEGLRDNGALHAVAEACAAAGAAPAAAADALLSLEAAEAVLSVEGAGLPLGCMLHFAYKLTRAQQFVSTPLEQRCSSSGGDLGRDVIVAYSQLRAGMFDHAGEHVAGPLQTLRFEARREFGVLALSGPDAELFVAMDPLVGKGEAARAGGALLRWLRSRHAELFSP